MSKSIDWSAVDWSAGLPVAAGPMVFGLTEATPETAEYWRRISTDGVLVLKKCAACGALNHPRAVLCSSCMAEADALQWIEPEQSGTIYSLSTVHHGAFPELAEQVPYHLGIVLMAGDVPIFARVESHTGEFPKIGDRVHVTVKKLFGKDVPVFRTGPAPRDPAE